MRTEEEMDSTEDLALAAFMAPVKHNLGILKELARTKEEKRAVQTVAWFFCLGPRPKPRLVDRIRILPWALMDRIAAFKGWVLNEEE